MVMSVVLYAEGVREDARCPGLPKTPGDLLPEDRLGPAHVLARRCLASFGGLRDIDIEFVAPMRVGPRLATGSDLHVPRRLRKLLAWPVRHRRPDLAVVLVDEDGDRTRRNTLEDCVKDLMLETVIGVPAPEFEAWLMADHSVVGSVLSISPAPPPQLDQLQPGEAKKLFAQWVAERAGDAAEGPEGAAADPEIRMELARISSLERLQKLRSFELFAKALGHAGGS